MTVLAYGQGRGLNSDVVRWSTIDTKGPRPPLFSPIDLT